MFESPHQNELKNQLQVVRLAFKLSNLKSERHATYLKYYAAKQKIRIALKARGSHQLDETRLPDVQEEGQVQRMLLEYVRHLEIPTMPESMEKKIVSLIPETLRARRFLIFNRLMTDVKEQYIESMKKSIDQILLAEKFPQLESNNPIPISAAETQKKRNGFSTMKKQLQNRLPLKNKIVRTMMAFIVEQLPVFPLNLDVSIPNCYVNVPGLQGRSAIPKHFLLTYMRKNFDEYNTKLSSVFYPKLCRLLKRKQINKKQDNKRILKCLEGFIVRQMNEMKQNTLAKLLKILGNERSIPMIGVELGIEKGKIILSPTLKSFEGMYVSIAKDIANLGVKKLLPLNEMLLGSHGATLIESSKKKYLKLNMNAIYVGELTADLKHIMRQTYKPILIYVEEFQNRFEGLIKAFRNCPTERSKGQSDFSTIKENYYEYAQLHEILQLDPRNVYFPSAVIQTDNVLEELLKATKLQMRLQLQGLTAQHIEMMEDIRKDFERFKSLVLRIPVSTEELIELRVIVSEAETTRFHEMVKKALMLGYQILDITNFTDAHLALILKTVEELNQIDNVRRRGLEQVEHFDAIFRNHLRMTIDKLNRNLQKLDEMAKVIEKHSKNKNGVREIRETFFEQLHEAEDSLSWIHKEEKLFDMPKTIFPALRKIKKISKKFPQLDELKEN